MPGGPAGEVDPPGRTPTDPGTPSPGEPAPVPVPTPAPAPAPPTPPVEPGRPAPPPAAGSPAFPAGPGVTSPRPGSRRSATDSLARWEFWWEHNKERFLERRVAEAVSGTDELDRTVEVESAREGAVVPVLTELMGHDHCGCRAAAARALGFAGTADDATVLLRGLKDPCPEVRGASAMSAALLTGEKAVPHVRRLLDDPKETPAVRALAAAALGLAGGGPAEGILSEVLADSTAPLEVRCAAALGLGRLDGDEVAERLSAVLADDRLHPDLRAMAASVLGRQGRLDATASLARVLEDERVDVRRSAALALGAVRYRSEEQDTLRAALARYEDWTSRGSMSEEARADLEATIKDLRVRADAEDRRVDGIRREAVRLLRRAADKDPDRQTRGFAIIALGEIGGGDVSRTLAEILGRKSHPLRAWACLAAGLAGEDRLSSGLAARLGDRGEDASVRAAAAIGLGLLRDASAANSLAAVAREKSADPDLRGYAALALAMTGAPSAAEVLPELVVPDGPRGLVRSGALALGIAGGRGTGDRLLDVLEHAKYREVRASAALGLRYLASGATLLGLARRGVDSSVPFEQRILAIVAAGEAAGRFPLSETTDHLAWHVNYRVLAPGLRRLIALL